LYENGIFKKILKIEVSEKVCPRSFVSYIQPFDTGLGANESPNPQGHRKNLELQNEFSEIPQNH
jgi:hypothetical protein